MNMFQRVKIIHIVLILVGVLIGGLLGVGGMISGEAVFGLLGVIIGAFIPSVFQNWAARLDRKNQLRLAAVEKRLEVHQKAYSLWVLLRSKAHKPEETWDYVIECQEWWNANCLYLAPKARIAFQHAFTCASNHRNFIDERKLIVQNSKSDKKRLSEINDLITKNWQDIVAAGKAIVEGVELPTIGEEDFSDLKPEQKKS